MNFNEVEPEMVVSLDSALGVFIDTHFEELDQRSNRLARALRRFNAKDGATVAVVVCDDTEGLVAIAAIRKLGCDVIEIPCQLSAAVFAERFRASGATMTLACTDGSQMWLESGVGGIILGDGEGVRWWKLAELRESSDPLID